MLRDLFRKLGPGLIAGASDDDPTAIATYSQAGAQLGFGMLWAALFAYPLMVTAQQISAQIGRVTGHGLAWNMRHHFPKRLVYPLVGALFTANTIGLGADLNAMGEVMKLLIGGPALVYSTAFALLSLALEVFVPYSRYVPYLKGLTLALLAYAATAFVMEIPWREVVGATLFPSLRFDRAYLTIFVALLGAMLSPYIFFWQATGEAEEQKNHHREAPLKEAPEQAPEQFERMKIDTTTGMAFASLIAYFIILTCAMTLHTQGIHQIQSTAQAAEALRPVSGRFASVLFSMGMIGTGLLAIPVLAGSAAYAIGETMQWRVGLEQKPRRAKRFYATLAAAMLLGLAFNFLRINPIQALFWAALIYGVVAAPVMGMMVILASSPKVMGRFTLSRWLKGFGWVTTLVLSATALGLFAATLL
ncbi:MAG: divalent metal cation transporter [Candidatus Manganitrophus sp. SB1]|nr:divalent metal cation transporter [Candidatus Manganitrophus morganii]